MVFFWSRTAFVAPPVQIQTAASDFFWCGILFTPPFPPLFCWFGCFFRALTLFPFFPDIFQWAHKMFFFPSPNLSPIIVVLFFGQPFFFLPTGFQPAKPNFPPPFQCPQRATFCQESQSSPFSTTLPKMPPLSGESLPTPSPHEARGFCDPRGGVIDVIPISLLCFFSPFLSSFLDSEYFFPHLSKVFYFFAHTLFLFLPPPPFGQRLPPFRTIYVTGSPLERSFTSFFRVI